MFLNILCFGWLIIRYRRFQSKMKSHETALTALKGYINSGNIVTIDGATGTEVSVRAGPGALNGQFSSVLQLSVPEVVKEVHEAYIEAGAQIIICNTYGTNRNILAEVGIPEKTPEAIAVSVKLAKEAAAAAGPKHLPHAGNFQPP